MKGIIQGFALLILMMGLSLGFMFYVALDHLRSQSLTILKQSMTETLMELSHYSIEDRNTEYQTLFINSMALRKPSLEHYQIQILAFNADPLAIRVRLIVYPSFQLEGNGYPFEETMIEVNHD